MITRSHGTGSIHIPYPAPANYLTGGIYLTGYNLTIYDPYNAANIVLNGNSSLSGSTLTTDDVSLGIGLHSPVINNGQLTLKSSTLDIGALSGHGKITATSGSTLDIISAPTSETIQIHSSALNIGANGMENPGMTFLAPITGFDSSSQITLEDTTATLGVYFRQSGAFFLFDGSQMVADLTIKGAPNIYANQFTSGPYESGAPQVTLSGIEHGGHTVIAVHTSG